MKVWVAVGLLVGFSEVALAAEPAIPAAVIRLECRSHRRRAAE